MFEYALKGSKREPIYCLWSALSLLYLFRRANSTEKKLRLASKCQKYAIESLEANYYNLNAVFILLNLYLEARVLGEFDFKPEFTAEDLAVWAKEVNEYKGYLAWAEIYIKRGDIKFAKEVLEELIEFYPENPEAYFRLWKLVKKDSDEALELAEKMFVCCTNFYMLETK